MANAAASDSWFGALGSVLPKVLSVGGGRRGCREFRLKFVMGIRGSGPLDSDTAEDYLDELEEQSVSQRLTVVEKTFRSAIGAGVGPIPLCCLRG